MIFRAGGQSSGINQATTPTEGDIVPVVAPPDEVTIEPTPRFGKKDVVRRTLIFCSSKNLYCSLCSSVSGTGVHIKINLDDLLNEWVYTSTAPVLSKSRELVVGDELVKVLTLKRTMSYLTHLKRTVVKPSKEKCFS